MMPLRIRSNRGVDKEEAAAIVGEARTVAARYPGDAGVLTALAEAEHDAGNDDAAIAAADKAIALDRTRANAYVQKGYAMFRKAADNGGDEAAYRRARGPFVALNKIEPDHPLTLVFYYRSFVMAGVKPPELAVKGIERAAEIAPFDLGLRMTVAMQELRDGRRDDAKRNLAPVAYNPHGGGLAEEAQKVLARIEAEPNWKGEGAVPVGEDVGKD
jgi:tetratricopeptide (TPR) repeat protein